MYLLPQFRRDFSILFTDIWIWKRYNFNRIYANHDQSCTDAEIARSELLISVFSAKELFRPFKNEPNNFTNTGYESKYRHFFLKNVQPK